ncbi:MAG: hypothetical protein FJX74_20440, partial [Armatimonadetes bacterium]|nr:hypothetical protein [Armatimonadota bacterium]
MGLSLLAALAARAQEPVAYGLLDTEPGEYTLAVDVAATKGWLDGSEVRLAFDITDDRHLAYVRLRGGRASLVRVSDGSAAQVGQARAVQPPNLWNAALQRREGRVRLVALGRAVLDEPWPDPILGRVGTWSSGDVQLGEPLLQPNELPFVQDDFTRDADDLGPWTVLAGQWRNTLVSAPKATPSQSANPFGFRTSGEPTALARTGYWFWDAYRATVSVRPLAATEVGLAAFVQDGGNMLLFRWRAGAPDAPQARQLVLLRDGKETVLTSAPGGFERDQWYRLELGARPGRLEALIDRYPALAADTDAFSQGGVGVLASGGDAVFDDLAIASVDAPRWETPRINPVFLTDETMTANELYQPAGQWRSGEAGVLWNWGYYPGDLFLRVPAGSLAGPLTVLVRGDGSSLENAYAVSLQFDGGALRASLKRAPDLRVDGTCPTPADGEVVVSAIGGTVRVICGGAEALRFTDAAPLSGKLLGLLGASTEHVNALVVASPNFRDDAFDSAPSDWFGGRGIWQVTTRWPCQPGWTFFGGTHNENPTLWTKHSYSGDTVLEFFANLPMDVPPPPGYSRPSDLDAALCGDGVDLGSGYAFVFAGWRNTKSAILRRGQVVAETTDAVFVDPTSSNFNFHRHWFRVRVEKIGGRIAMSVDGREVLSYVDPDPLPGGRAALFSFHNGLMIGRSRLWFAEEIPGGVVPPRLPGAAPPAPQPREGDRPIVDDFEQGLGEWQTFADPSPVELLLDDSTAAGGRRSLRVRNLVSGGPMGAYTVVTPFRATDYRTLSFDYRIPPGVAVNVYLHCSGTWHAIRLGADEPTVGGAPLLGAISGVQCDDTWRHAELDFFTPLAALHPESPVLTVRYVAFAAPEESYVRCGIGGNRR